MGALFRFLVLRWSRALAGRAAAAVVLAFPLVLAVVAVVGSLFQSGGEADPLRRSLREVPTSWSWGLVLSLLFAVVNLLAHAVDAERRSGRSRLLRVGGLDGLPPVGAYLLFGAGLALLLPLGAVLPILVLGTLAGIATPATWLLTALASGLTTLQVVPLAVGGAFFLPRPVALLALNSAALVVPFLPLFATAGGAAPFVPDATALGVATAVNAVASLLLARQWRRQSARFWS